MTREQVLIEFAMRQDAAGWTVDAQHWQVNAMADEIVRLRRWNAARKTLLSDYKRSVELHNKVIDELMGNLASVQTERDTLRFANTKLGQRIAAVEAERDALREQLAAVEAEVAPLAGVDGEYVMLAIVPAKKEMQSE